MKQTSILALAVLGHSAIASPIFGTKHAPQNVVPQSVTQVRPVGRSPPSSRALRAARTKGSSYAPLLVAEDGAGYAIDILFGGANYSVIFDTGSSDLWLPSQDFQCLNFTGSEIPLADCDFGPLFKGTFNEGTIADENFNITYGDGEFLVGPLGYETVSIAGITVDKQEAALPDQGYWSGDNVTSGLIGFAYPALTSAFEGTDPSNDSVPEFYNPFFINAIGQGKVDSYFSLVIERGPTGGGGQLALGALPTLSFNHTFASTPLKTVNLFGDADGIRNYTYYTIVPDGFVISAPNNPELAFLEFEQMIFNELLGISSPGAKPTIVDSGTTLLYLPNHIAEAINAAFNPPAVYSEYEGVFEVDCNATAPSVAVRIGGEDFYINGKDLLLTGESGLDPFTGLCLTGVQPGFEAPYILGDVFLKNVVAVFDVGKGEMRFAPHETY